MASDGIHWLCLYGVSTSVTNVYIIWLNIVYFLLCYLLSLYIFDKINFTETLLYVNCTCLCSQEDAVVARRSEPSSAAGDGHGG